MKKTSISFRALRPGSYQHRFFLGKKNRRRWRNVAVGVAASVSLSLTANAQCNTFQNADAANPLLSVLPTGKKIAGFAFADIDGDGDQDVYVDFLGIRSNSRDPLHLFRNIGTKTHPVFKEDTLTGFGKFRAGGQNGQMQFVDIDGDGDLDYFASDSTYDYYGGAHIFYYKNVGTPKVPQFEQSSFDALPIFGTRYMQPFQFVDIDGDGDYDLYEASVFPYSSTEAYQQRVYYNIGTPQNAEFDKFVYVEDDGALYRTYYDWNRDGQLDYFASSDYYNGRGNTKYYRHTGSVNNLTYVLDRNTGPDFENGPLYRIIDLNNDGAPEVFDFNAHYSTLAPVAVIEDTLVKKGNQMLTILSSKNRSASYMYRWEYNGKNIPGANDYYIAAKQPGTYTLYITDLCGTGISLNYELMKSQLLGEGGNNKLAINKTAAPIASIHSYPNPFSDAIIIELPAGKIQENTIIITDMQGRIVLTKTMSERIIRVGNQLPAGSYVLQVWQRNMRIYQKVIIRQ